ncbi:hypothetical protein CHUAL_007206 [Chamberlinius hualienensis]
MDDSEDSRTLYCGNLSEEVTEELLYELFLQAGPIQKVSIPTVFNGKRRNYGFVTYKHAVSVPYAVKLLSEESLFKRKLVLRGRGQANESPKHSPKSDERRYSLPDVSVIHENKRRSYPHQSSPHNHHSNQVVLMNPLHNEMGYGSPLFAQIPPPVYTHFKQLPTPVISSPIFIPNRYHTKK